MYLIDTNIFIHFLKADEGIIESLSALVQDTFYISVISRFEVLVGADKENYSVEEIESYIDQCVNLDLNSKIVNEALKIMAHTKKKLKFKDLLIAATAKVHGFTLITCDRDFDCIDGMDILTIIK